MFSSSGSELWHTDSMPPDCGSELAVGGEWVPPVCWDLHTWPRCPEASILPGSLCSLGAGSLHPSEHTKASPKSITCPWALRLPHVGALLNLWVLPRTVMSSQDLLPGAAKDQMPNWERLQLCQTPPWTVGSCAGRPLVSWE